MAALGDVSLLALRRFCEHRVIGLAHVLKSRRLSNLCAGAAPFRNLGFRRSIHRGRNHVGARLPSVFGAGVCGCNAGVGRTKEACFSRRLSHFARPVGVGFVARPRHRTRAALSPFPEHPANCDASLGASRDRRWILGAANRTAQFGRHVALDLLARLRSHRVAVGRKSILHGLSVYVAPGFGPTLLETSL